MEGGKDMIFALSATNDLNFITTLISQIGFPIVMCFVLFWFINKQDERYSSQLQSMQDTIDANTAAIRCLLASIEKIDKGV